MSRRLCQQTHRRAEKQSEHYQYTNRVECVSAVNVDLACCGNIACSVRHHVCGSVGQLVHGDDRNNKETEYDECDEDVDKLVNAGAAVEGDVGV